MLRDWPMLLTPAIIAVVVPLAAGPPLGTAVSLTSGPRRTIALEIRYPSRNQRVVPDSNFLFGSVGSSAATLEIDGVPVQVEESGAFLAWLPVPEPTRGDTAFYGVRVIEGADTVTVSYPILRPPSAPPAGAPSPWLRTEPFESPSVRWYHPGEEFTLEVTGEAGAEVHLEAGEARFALADLGVERGTLHRYGGRIDASVLHAEACRAGRCRSGEQELQGADDRSFLVPLDTVTALLVARADGRETRSPVRFHLTRFPDPAPVVRLVEADDPVNGESGVIVGRPTPFGPYRWRFPEGTVSGAAGRVGGRVALDLGGGQKAWVNADDVLWGVDPAPPPARAYDGRVEEAGRSIDLRLGLSRAAPARVTVTGPRSLRLTVYGTYGEISRFSHGSETGVERIDWTQSPGPGLHIDIMFEWPIWGHRLTIESGDARGYEGPDASVAVVPGEWGSPVVLRLAVRRPPRVDPMAPLRGVRVAVDPGHPGAGSYGPTGLFEGDANLAIARSLIAMLENAGADPVIIRADRAAVGLYDRTARAREAGADLLVSIHNNALPDGVRPFDRAGTSTFYYHPHSAGLARRVQAGLVGHLGLEDRGVLWGDLAMVREPWMPAVLAEGAFMMIPRHEAALRTAGFQERYARGVFEGIEAFLRDHAEQP